MLAIAMILETIVIALIAIGFGLIVDFIMDITMISSIDITGYKWLYYLILICGQLIGTILMTIVFVIRRAIAMPVNAKYN